MTTLPNTGTPVTFTDALPSGIRRNLGGVRDGVVTQVTWGGRIGVQVENVGVVWVDAIDVEEVTE